MWWTVQLNPVSKQELVVTVWLLISSVEIQGWIWVSPVFMELLSHLTQSLMNVVPCVLKGVIGPGGVQWMTAGRGIVHSEMPAVTTGDLWGFQLWINLPAKNKMVKPRYQQPLDLCLLQYLRDCSFHFDTDRIPCNHWVLFRPWISHLLSNSKLQGSNELELFRYQDYQAEDIPVVEKNGMRVRVMAGESYGAIGPIKMQNPGMLLDVQLEKGADFQQQVKVFCWLDSSHIPLVSVENTPSTFTIWTGFIIHSLMHFLIMLNTSYP